MLEDPAPDAASAYNEAFYTGAKQYLREYVTEPYFYPVDGEDVLMISIVAPIISNGDFLGVVGIDITPDRLQAALSDLQLYQSGFGRLISHEGTVVTHPFTNRIGETAPEWLDDVPEMDEVRQLGTIRTFESISLATGQISIKSFVPVLFADSPNAWYYGTVAPPAEVYAFSSQITRIYSIITFSSLVILILIMWLLLRSFLIPLRKAESALSNVAQGEGDLTQQLAIKNHDEVGRLSEHFNTFTASLSGIIRSIRVSLKELQNSGSTLASSMEQTSAAVYQINASIDSIKNRTDDQSSSVNEVSSNVEEIVQNIQNQTRLIQHQGTSLENSSAAIEQMVANIQSVTKNVESSMNRIQELDRESEHGDEKLRDVSNAIHEISERSEGLGEANKIIHHISAQTNLLAMNAAIEAAHAGDAGRGFAVVADEIRKLAETSATQSKNITQSLNALKSLIDEVVTKVLDVAQNFSSVRVSVHEVTERQQQIKHSMEEQNSGSTQILHSLEELRETNQEVTAGSSEMADGSQAVLREIHQLLSITREIEDSMNQMAHGTEEINKAITDVVSLTAENNQGIQGIEQEIMRFRIQEESV